MLSREVINSSPGARIFAFASYITVTHATIYIAEMWETRNWLPIQTYNVCNSTTGYGSINSSNKPSNDNTAGWWCVQRVQSQCTIQILFQPIGARVILKLCYDNSSCCFSSFSSTSSSSPSSCSSASSSSLLTPVICAVKSWDTLSRGA